MTTYREDDRFSIIGIDRVGEVVARRDLATGTSSTGSESESNVIDVHMSRIRDKLGKHSGRIETVRGIGYRLRRS
jgi:DNA-binding response OmpR family regulator